MTILLAAQAVNEKTLRNYEMKIVFRSCHRDIELRRSSSSSSVVVPKWPLSASRKTGGFLARDCVALATILRHGSHLRSLLCNWSGCPIVAEKWCNLYTNIQVHHPGRALAVGPIDLASSFVGLLKRFKGRTEKPCKAQPWRILCAVSTSAQS